MCCHFDIDSDKHLKFSSINNTATKLEVKDSSSLITTVNLCKMFLGSFYSLDIYLFICLFLKRARMYLKHAVQNAFPGSQ